MQPRAEAQPCWLAGSEQHLPATETWLAPAEARIAAGLRTTKRRTEYLLRRWICKRAVAAELGMPTDLRSLGRIEVANRPGGAPYVRLDGSPVQRSVSMSDRAGWAVCVISADRDAVGCDIELVEHRSPAFVADFLTPLEQTAVSSCGPDRRDVVANLIWSAKESALKVQQTGLGRDTRSVEVRLGSDGAADHAGWSALTVGTGADDRLPGWWRRDGAFVLTVVTAAPSHPPRRLDGSEDLASAAPSHSWLDRPSR